MKVAYSGSKNLYPYINASLRSLLDHNKVEKVYLLIEDDEFPFELPKYRVNGSGEGIFIVQIAVVLMRAVSHHNFQRTLGNGNVSSSVKT